MKDDDRRKLSWDQCWESYSDVRRLSSELVADEAETTVSEDSRVVVMGPSSDPLMAKLEEAAGAPYLAAVETGAGFHAASAQDAEGEDEIFTVGDVLQLSPALFRAGERRLFVYVLGIEDGRVEVALFSPLDIPACGEEIRTGLGKEGLGVLELWNTRYLPSWVLVKSWRICVADEALRTEIAAMEKVVSEGGEVPRQSAEVDDVPSSPLDGRWEYFEMEKSLLESIQAEDGSAGAAE